MDIKIVADSSCDLSDELKENMNIELAPLTLEIQGKRYVDDETLDLKDYLKEMRESDEIPKTSCPSPECFMKSYKGKEKNVFVVTLSSALSGTYNSAVLAKNLFLEENGKKLIHIFNSYSASIAETLIVLKINELSKVNFDYSQIIKKVTKYIKGMKTFFVLENLDALVKTGRMKNVVAKIANVLNIKLVLGAEDDGNIRLVHKTRGYKKVFKKFIETIGEEGENLEEKILGISHCNCLERALAFKDEVLKKYNFKKIIIVEMRGLSATYANEGGIIIAF